MTANRFHFRVWFKPNWQDPEMYYEAEQTYDSACEGKGSDCHYSFGDVLNDKDCVVMQSTGLTDKNGKEIYEGDIVNIIKKFENFKDEVFYDEELCSIRLKGYSDNYCDFADWIREGFKFEVIGNIYENKELLGE